MRQLWCALTKIMELWLKLPFSFSSFFCTHPLSCLFPSNPLPSLGISSATYGWASAADSRRWPRRAKAALPREESSCCVALQTETQTLGQFPREEGWGAQHPERLAVGEWAWSGRMGMKCDVWEACLSMCIVTLTVQSWHAVHNFTSILSITLRGKIWRG